MEEIISKAREELDRNEIPPFAKMLYETHLRKAILKILLSQELHKKFKKFKNYRFKPQPERTMVSFSKNELVVQCRFICYEEKTGFLTYIERIPNFIIRVDIDGSTTVRYYGKDGYQTILTNELHIPCDLKF
tara:strand:+ start:450 stop:845 length:396 start_codon:yes stop_codon:yes gene_type:complete